MLWHAGAHRLAHTQTQTHTDPDIHRHTISVFLKSLKHTIKTWRVTRLLSSASSPYFFFFNTISSNEFFWLERYLSKAYFTPRLGRTSRWTVFNLFQRIGTKTQIAISLHMWNMAMASERESPCEWEAVLTAVLISTFQRRGEIKVPSRLQTWSSQR